VLLQHEPRQIASQWDEAFARHDAGLLEKILAPSWVDIPSPPDVEETDACFIVKDCAGLSLA
jgi:hypothetical protein